jgi:hypothetical protein
MEHLVLVPRGSRTREIGFLKVSLVNRVSCSHCLLEANNAGSNILTLSSLSQVVYDLRNFHLHYSILHTL